MAKISKWYEVTGKFNSEFSYGTYINVLPEMKQIVSARDAGTAANKFERNWAVQAAQDFDEQFDWQVTVRALTEMSKEEVGENVIRLLTQIDPEAVATIGADLKKPAEEQPADAKPEVTVEDMEKAVEAGGGAIPAHVEAPTEGEQVTMPEASETAQSEPERREASVADEIKVTVPKALSPFLMEKLQGLRAVSPDSPQGKLWKEIEATKEENGRGQMTFIVSKVSANTFHEIVLQADRIITKMVENKKRGAVGLSKGMEVLKKSLIAA